MHSLEIESKASYDGDEDDDDDDDDNQHTTNEEFTSLIHRSQSDSQGSYPSSSTSPRTIIAANREDMNDSKHHRKAKQQQQQQYEQQFIYPLQCKILFFVTCIFTIIIFYTKILSKTPSSTPPTTFDNKVPPGTVFVDTEGILQYTCPPPLHRNNDEEVTMYNEFSKSLINNDMTIDKFINTFRYTEFDNWGHTYQEVKLGSLQWKSNHFVENIPIKNAMIYESACVIGLNLYMTLEIIQQFAETPARNITIYGNEYAYESVKLAHRLAKEGKLFDQVHARFGTICNADSLDLHKFVPANMFDIVYTGYITPNMDPLELKGSTIDDNFRIMTEHCDNPKHKALAIQAQERQDSWYRDWVSEMIRIAKPGAPIIIEQVSWPLCEAIFDWGGVSPDFWSRTIETYWNESIDPHSLETEKDTIFRKRYHVFMRKKR